VLLASAAVVLVACLAGASLVHRHHDGPTTAGPTATQPAVVGPTRAATTARPRPSPTMACLVDYQVTDYGIGFQAALTLTNRGTAGISRWTLEFDLPAEQKLAVGWGGVWKQDGTRITVSDLLVNGSVQTGKSVDIGFVGTYQGKLDKPERFSLNGVGCDESDG
jgi:cellulase/cellobiase CelA1